MGPRRPLAVWALLVVMTIGAGAAWAAADSRVDRQAWAQTGAVPVAAPAEGRIYIGAFGGAEYARTFVHVQVRDLDPASLAGARLVLLEDPADSVASAAATVAVCALAGPFQGQGRTEGSLPPADCTLREDARRTAEGAWVVELAMFAERLSGAADHGLALFPGGSSPTSTFRVSLQRDRTVLEGVGPPISAKPESEPEAGAEPASGPPLSLDDLAPPSVAVEPGAPVDANAGAAPQAAASGPVSAEPPPAGPIAAAAVRPFARDASSPGALGFMAALAFLAAAALAALRKRGVGVVAPPRLSGVRGLNAIVIVTVVGLALTPLRYSELTVFKAGIVLIFVVAALGLHVLVNWAGQLSLAHASMVGLPAFSVLTISAVHDISPLYLLPVGLLIGALAGVLVALPTLRARGLQVALVTFAAGIAIERFFFTKSWLVGPVGGRRTATPALGPVEFTTSKGLYPVVLATVAVVALALWALMHSRVGRAWFWIRSDPDAAAAVGVPVGPYKVLAFATAGALAGVAGSLYAAWVQHFAGNAFPSTRSFDYLLVAVLAGAGYVGGVFGAALLLQGGRLFFSFFGWLDTAFDYAGPLGLIYNLTAHQSGFNGFGRLLMETLTRKLRLRPAPGGTAADRRPEPVTLAFVAGAVMVAAGFVAIALAWYHTGNTDEVWLQNQELASGGIGGLAAVVVGATLLVRDRLGRQHAILARQLEVMLAASAPPDGSGGEVVQPRRRGRRTVAPPGAGGGPGQPVRLPNP